MQICLHTLWSLSPDRVGGTERFLIDLSKELKHLGHEPFILCTQLTEYIEVEGIEVYGYIPHEYRDIFIEMGVHASGFMLKRLPRGYVEEQHLREISAFVEKQLATVSADIIHLNSFYAALFTRDTRPVIVTNHENREECSTYLGDNFFEKMTKMVRNGKTKLHQHSALTVPSHYYAEEYSKEMYVHVEGNNLGVCLDNFPVPDARRRAQFRRRHNDPIRILLPSRLKMYQKGHDLALDACATLKKSGIPFTLTISGINESYRKDLDELFRMAELRGIREDIIAKRFDNIQAAYEMTDVVISPERYCSYGLAISEALSAGIPTVLSDIPTYKEIAERFRHAFFMRSGHSDDLSAQISASQELNPRVLADEAVRFREIFDLRFCAKRFSELYRLNHTE